MNGRRCKILRAQFKAEHKRPPNKSNVPSEWRQIKKLYKSKRG